MSDMIVKNLSFGNKAKQEVFKGIEKLTKAVSSTLGASGKCVLLEDSFGNPTITKDGVTVADSVILKNPIENLGCSLLKQAARKTVKEAGDGTTTATVLAQAIVKEGMRYVAAGGNPIGVKRGIDKAVQEVLDIIPKYSVLFTNLNV